MSLLATLLVTTLPAAHPAAQEPVAQQEEILGLYIADAETFFVDPKDAALLEALRLVDDRVLELGVEIPGFPMLPPEVVRVAAHVLTGEKSLRIGMSSDPNLPFPIYGQLDLIEGSQDEARQLANSLLELGAGAGLPMGQARPDGLSPVELHDAPFDVVFGARGERVLLSVGTLLDEPFDLGVTGLPEGVKPSYKLNFDLGKALELGLLFARMESDPGAQQMQPLLEMMRSIAVRFEVAGGSDDVRSYTVTRVPGYATTMSDMGLMPKRTLTRGDLALIPQDATWAAVSTVNFQGFLDYMLTVFEEPLAQQGMGDPLGMIAAMTGFHLETDVLDHLGDTWGIYASDTTGGGGFLSMVAYVELADSDGLLDTTERLQDMVNRLVASQTEGYVQMRTWERGETTFTTLVFPGLPIPAEPTFAFTESHLIMTLTPGAALAAVQQAAGADTCLAHHAGFRENLPGDVEGAYSVSFFDTPKLLRDGYGVTNLLCSALVNGTRSRNDATRDAGVIMPSFHELAQGAMATVSLTRVVGEDFVTRTHADRSILVNATSTVGFLVSSPLLLAVPAALLVGTVGVPTSEPAFIYEDFEDHPDYVGDDEDH